MLCIERSWPPAYGPFCRRRQQTALQCKDVRKQSPGAKMAVLHFHITMDFKSQHQRNLSSIKLLPSIQIIPRIIPKVVPNLPTENKRESTGKQDADHADRRAPPELRTNISPGLWCLGRLKTAPPRPCRGIKVFSGLRLEPLERLNLISPVAFSGQMRYTNS